MRNLRTGVWRSDRIGIFVLLALCLLFLCPSHVSAAETTIKVGEKKNIWVVLSRREEDQGLGAAVYSWSSGNPGVATVTGAGTVGQVTGVSEGTCIIYCNRMSPYKKYTFLVRVSNSGGGGGGAGGGGGGGGAPTPTPTPPQTPKVTSIKLNHSSLSLQKGKRETLTYELYPQGTTAEVSFKSSNSKVASVSQKGVVKARGKGSAVITARTSSGIKASCRVRVYLPEAKSVKLSKKSLKLKKGSSQKLTYKLAPKGCVKTVTWKSSNSRVASVSRKGVVKGLRKGSAKITVRAKSGVKAVCKVQVFIPKAESVTINPRIVDDLEVGKNTKLTCTLAPKGCSGKVKWMSEDPDVASVNAEGVVTGKKIGVAVIYARVSSSVYDFRYINVFSPIKKITLDKNNLKINVGERGFLTSTISPEKARGSVSFRSSDSNIASVYTIGGSMCGIVAYRAGEATVTATASSGVSASCKVQVLGPVESIEFHEEQPFVSVGKTLKLSPVTVPAYTADTISWYSGDPTIAEVSPEGVVKGIREGKVTITAEANGHMSDVDILVTKGLWLDISKGSITFEGENRVRHSSKDVNESYEYDPKTGVTIVQSKEGVEYSFIIEFGGFGGCSNAYCILAGVNIEAWWPVRFYNVDIRESHVVLELMEGTENYLTALSESHPAISVGGVHAGNHLYIQGNGRLYAYSQESTAIGGNAAVSYGGNIEIRSGDITARTDNPISAVIGIDGNAKGKCGKISILSGAHVTAIGGCKAVGAGENSSEDGEIYIEEGTLTYQPLQ